MHSFFLHACFRFSHVCVSCTSTFSFLSRMCSLLVRVFSFLRYRVFVTRVSLARVFSCLARIFSLLNLVFVYTSCLARAFSLLAREQPRTQGPSSSRPLERERDPGYEVDPCAFVFLLVCFRFSFVRLRFSFVRFRLSRVSVNFRSFLVCFRFSFVCFRLSLVFFVFRSCMFSATMRYISKC